MSSRVDADDKGSLLAHERRFGYRDVGARRRFNALLRGAGGTPAPDSSVAPAPYPVNVRFPPRLAPQVDEALELLRDVDETKALAAARRAATSSAWISSTQSTPVYGTCADDDERCFQCGCNIEDGSWQCHCARDRQFDRNKNIQRLLDRQREERAKKQPRQAGGRSVFGDILARRVDFPTQTTSPTSSRRRARIRAKTVGRRAAPRGLFRPSARRRSQRPPPPQKDPPRPPPAVSVPNLSPGGKP